MEQQAVRLLIQQKLQDGRLLHMRTLGLSLLVALVVAISPPPAVTQTILDPESLVGVWSGRWAVHTWHGPRGGGQCYLTINKVEANTVHAVIEILGTGATKSEFTGRLEGDRILREGGRMEFTVTGNLMKGTFLLPRGSWDHANMELRKTKVD